MKKIRVVIIFTVSVFIIALVIFLFSKGKIDDKISSNLNSDIDYYDEDEETKYNVSTTITLSESSVEIVGQGASVLNSVITISSSGNYEISGKLNDGNIIIDANKEDIIRIKLNNIYITSSTYSPIYVKSAKKVILTLEESTTNRLVDCSEYVYDDTAGDEPKATIFSKSDLVINGTGTLNITSNFNDAISTNDALRIIGGNFNITSVDDGIRGKDYVYIKNANLNLDVVGDGIKSTNSKSDEVGFIIIENGNFDINSGSDGIDATSSLYIKNGSFNINSGGGNTVNNKNNNNYPNFKNTIEDSDSESDQTSTKGLKADGIITIENGDFTIDSSDDAIHSNNVININGGNINIKSGDDGIHSDNQLVVNGGTIDILVSYEGVESSNIKILSGKISIISRDDGINAANSNNIEENVIEINGGEIIINAEGDGIDSNGKIYINGGDVTVYGPVTGGNGILDCDGTLLVNGGKIIATGTSDMLQLPESKSEQYSIVINLSSYANSDTSFVIKDSDGNEIVKSTPDKKYSTIIFSSSSLVKDETYSIYVNDVKIDTVTISDVITIVGNINNNMNKMRK